MPREKEGYRGNLELLQQLFPGRAAISLPEAAKVIGKKEETYRGDATWPRTGCGKQAVVPLAELARRMSL